MKSKPFISILAVATVLTAHAMANRETNPRSEKLWRDVPVEIGIDVEQSSRIVIRTQEEWHKWLAKHSQSELSNDQIAAIKVDFAKETLVIAAMGMRNTGGYSIAISEVIKVNDSLKITVKSTSPGPGSRVSHAITYPIAVVAVPKHDGKVEFTEE